MFLILFHFQFFKDEMAQEAYFHLQRLLLPRFYPFILVGEAGISQLVNKVGGEDYWTERRKEEGDDGW